MQKVKFIQSYKENKIGDVATVMNNQAHFLIENGYARLYKEKMMKPVADKMMRSETKEHLADKRTKHRQIYKTK